MNNNLLHDLRLPLQLIQSGAALARLALEDPTLDAGEYLDQIRDNVRTLNDMLNSALSNDNIRRMNVVSLLRGLCLRCQGYAAERRVTLSFTSNADALEILADEALLNRAALNLIMNALRVTPAGGRVRVHCAALGDFLEISVQDDGPGIAPDQIPYIFLQGETDGGTGCGLPSALACADALGGAITVDSRPGQGATFTLRLPVRAALAFAAAQR